MASRPVSRLHALDVGDGPPIVLLHGYGLSPRAYRPLAELLADRARVVIPAIFALPVRWTYDHALAALEATLDDLGLDRVSLIGHSFGGGLELGLAARRPDRVVECVFADTLGVAREWGLAEQAVRPVTLVRLATPTAALAFFNAWAHHPVQLARAAWWGFVSDRATEMRTVRAEGLPCHVLWAGRDTLLNRSDGEAFAAGLGATFTVAECEAGGGPIDHDWMYRHPRLFVAHLERLGLKALL